MTFTKLNHKAVSEREVISNTRHFLNEMISRRSVRHFSDRPIPLEAIQNIIMTASSAPSGANKQPWKFIIVQNSDVKRKIRIAAEKEEKEFYTKRAPQAWLDDLRELGTDWHKEFLEVAPYLIAVFKILYEEKTGLQRKHNYVNESVGIACGILISAIHKAGLVTLTHTPSPMGFLQKILNRPKNEKPFLLLPVGYPAEDAEVPKITKKNFNEVARII
ncbi:MAG: nitroreductase family protein [Candidatus Neomarinimicrobiota bacterium]